MTSISMLHLILEQVETTQIKVSKLCDNIHYSDAVVMLEVK